MMFSPFLDIFLILRVTVNHKFVKNNAELFYELLN